MKLSEWCKQSRGRQAALAVRLNIKQPTVADWLSGKKQVALDHCPLIQEATNNEVTCEELRPDKAAYFALIRAQASHEPVTVTQAD
ncbi:MAG: helix-turn-helix domain-containing protein [Ramlibacter sp.]|nr:helix-turn-helix domain-containing protein [Ramlibacter sp.]